MHVFAKIKKNYTVSNESKVYLYLYDDGTYAQFVRDMRSPGYAKCIELLKEKIFINSLGIDSTAQ